MTLSVSTEIQSLHITLTCFYSAYLWWKKVILSMSKFSFFRIKTNIERFGLGDGTGPAEESKRTKRVQGWSRQIGLGTLFAIHTKLFSR